MRSELPVGSGVTSGATSGATSGVTAGLLRVLPLALLVVVAAVACADAPGEDASGGEGSSMTDRADAAPTLGPVDGRDLSRADLDRVAVGDAAPDFSLMSYRGDVLTLSENRGAKEIVLVFYRGHW